MCSALPLTHIIIMSYKKPKIRPVKTTAQRAPGELMMWWIAALLFVFLALDVVVKSTGASAKPPSLLPSSKS